MKIAVTGDVHLTSQDEHPERYNALGNIVEQMISEEINTIIIAGDLFDAHCQNYSEFDGFCRQRKYDSIKFYIIPGNHDSQLHGKHLMAKNVNVITDPEIISMGSPEVKFLFLPYAKDRTMGDNIALFKSDLELGDWVLIGHGNFIGGIREINPYEPGTYMPLTRKDIELYKPGKTLLGHIHKSMDQEIVHCVGSPCGLNINETGHRRFIVLDTDSLSVAGKTVDTDYLYFDESLIALPMADEVDYIRNKIKAAIKRWGVRDEEKSKIRARIQFRGYTSDARMLKQTINESLAGISFYNDEEPNLSGVSVYDDPERIEVANRVSAWIDELEWNEGLDHPSKDDILAQALKSILEV